MLQRGTTQELTFILPEAISIEVLYITFCQKEKTVLEKTLADVEVNENTITLQLSQLDTLQFCSKHAVYIQLRIRDTDGNALKSDTFRTDVDDVLKEGVI